jgi:hypothetical protein
MAVFPARLKTGHLLSVKNNALKMGLEWTSTLEVASVGSPELQWWYAQLQTWNGQSFLPSLPPTRSVHGCFGPRMGNCVEPTHLERSLEATVTPAAHQLLRTAGYLEGHPTSAATGFVSQTILRQYDHHIICEQVWRYAISSADDAGPTYLGLLF